MKIKTLPLIEMLRVFVSPNCSDLIIASRIDYNNRKVILYTGNIKKIKIPFEWFYSPVVEADFNDLEIIHCGNVIRFGQFEVEADTILYCHTDYKYRVNGRLR